LEINNRCNACGTANLLTFSDEEILCCGFCGCWQEADRTTTAVYDERYVAERYDRYLTTEAMSDLRRRVMEGVLHLHETMPQNRVCVRRGRLLDVGFGNGSFIRHARLCGWDAFGYDVNPTPYEGVRRVNFPLEPLPEEERYRVITFFDCLEHFEELSWAPGLAANTDWLVVSLPRVPDRFPKIDWKHRRRGEHHFHIRSAETLEILFSGPKFQAVAMYADNPEDTIRGSLPDGQPNVMTVVLKVIPANGHVVGR
jgi:hypothetical protein